MNKFQRTIKEPVTLHGIGLHTGESVDLSIHPAPENHGYRFQRTDLKGEPIIRADLNNVVGTERGTTIEQNGAKVYTTEHVLAALYGLQIDNALIKLNGPEVPILDGSSLPIVESIEKVGYTDQKAARDYYVLKETITFEDNEKNIEFLAVPTAGGEFRITVMVDYNSPVLGTQHASMYTIEQFKSEIAQCRTFVFLRELEQLAKAGLIKGGDLDNAIVLVERPNIPQEELDHLAELLGRKERVEVTGVGVLNTSKLQFENEPARHKLLDIVGDLALIGKPIRGHILAARPGHAGNVAFAKMIKEKIKKESKNGLAFDISKKPLYDINDIARMLPHRYPFLLIDKIMEKDDKSIIGVKNVTMNEPYFTGHFPENPVMPGVMQIEAMAQVGGIFALSSVPDPENYTTYFLKIDSVRFKKKVIPGDTLVIRLELISPLRRGIVNMKGVGYVNGEVAVEAQMMARVAKEEKE